MTEQESNDLWRHIVSTTGETYQATSPFPGELISSVPLSSIHDVDVAVNQARLVQSAWSNSSYEHRAGILSRYHDEVLRNSGFILDVIQRETGKARSHAMEEILHVAMNAQFLSRKSEEVLQTQKRAGAFPIFTQTQVRQVPKGVVGVISPWNYPFTLAITDALAAVMAGNAVVIKPDLQTVWSALYAVDILEHVGLPPGLISVVVGDGPTLGEALIDRVDYVCFTGSTATGKIVAQKSAARLLGTSLELGGKNPMIVCSDADLKKFVDIAIHACFTSAGQLCVSTERMYIAREIYDQALELLAEKVSKLRLKAEIGWGYEVGSLTTQAQLDRVSAALKKAISEGAQVVVGGRGRPDIGPLVFEPTLLKNVSEHMDIARHEVFGPCVFATPFDTESQAIAMANDSVLGLSGSVITKDVKRGRAIAAQLKCGSVNINEGFAAAFGSVAAPMGGMGESGLGRRHGNEGILRFTEPQTISVQHVLRVTPQFGLSDAQWASLMSKIIRILKVLRIR